MLRNSVKQQGCAPAIFLGGRSTIFIFHESFLELRPEGRRVRQLFLWLPGVVRGLVSLLTPGFWTPREYHLYLPMAR